MAHSALVSLMNTLELILRSDRFHFFHVKQHVISLYRKVRFLQALFQDYPEKSSEEGMNSLVLLIRDAAYAIEDMVELDISEQILSDPDRFTKRLYSAPDRVNSPGEEYQDIEEAIVEIDSIVEELLKDRSGLKCLLPRQYPPVVPSGPAGSGKSVMMVGFDQDVMELKHRLTGQEAKLQTISIVGMGGSGKTTLAKNLYNDLLVKYHFDVRAWVTISQTYLAHNVFQRLIEDIGAATDKQEDNSTQELKEILYRNLKGRRYLIVMDDMWSTEVWDDLRRMFPDDANGSRIMLTTRQMNMAAYAADSSSPHQMHLLDENKSWDLLCWEVFGHEGCPPEFQELEDIGKMIAHNCRGLPLTISVIGGLLANSNMIREFWKYVARNVKSIVIDDEHCSEILSLSYNHLPHHLQPCFLYFGIFPEDDEISVTKLIRLWIAEGFLKPIRSKSLEEAAEEYLKELIDRNLVLVHGKRSNGKARTCIIHDLLRDLCIKEAQKENFFHIINSSVQFSPDGMNVQRRLCMHLDIQKESDITDDLCDTMKSMAFARSLLCTGRIVAFPMYPNFRLLRVLDILRTGFSEFPHVILRLVNLRYLAVSFFSLRSLVALPPEMSLLWKLQVLISEDCVPLIGRIFYPDSESYHEIEIPSEILQMAQLRHLEMTECFLPNPIDGSNSVVLKDLVTLSTVANFRCTEEFLKKFPNLRKLRVYYYAAGIQDWSDYHLRNLVHLSKLENLKCIIDRPPNDTLLPNLIFPQSLKKLTLSGSKLFWKDMTIIGSLPNLEVLKLNYYAFVGAIWEPVEGEFCRLKFLLIDETDLVQWMAEKTHFPCLEHLIIRQCHDLEEIPSSIGDIETLEMIKIEYCSSSAAASAEQILEEQQSQGNCVLQVHVLNRHAYKELFGYSSEREFYLNCGSGSEEDF